jgi:SsrA-binding protein
MKDANIKMISENKKARFDFFIEDTFEAGMVLRGSEVKALRAGLVNLKDSYISFQGDEAFLQNAHISEYRASSYNNHIPERLRKILLHREELDKIQRAIQERGYTCVPTKIYFKGGLVKIEIGLAKGRKHGDKRNLVKERDQNREMAQVLRSKNRSGKVEE